MASESRGNDVRLGLAKAMSQTRGLGEPLPKVWRLDRASLQASAHRTSPAHDGPALNFENDAMHDPTEASVAAAKPTAAAACQ